MNAEIGRGKELHADEQAPAFLYTDVMDLEKCLQTLEEGAEKCYDLVVVRCLKFTLVSEIHYSFFG